MLDSPSRSIPTGRPVPTVLAALLLLLAVSGCGQPTDPGPEVEAQASAESTAEDSASEEPAHDDEVASQERRRQATSQRIDRGQVQVAVFEGRFLSCGQPKETTKALPLSRIDAEFILEVEVSSLTEGALPHGWTSPLRFAIHSPALFFGQQRLSVAEGSEVPDGEFVFEVWQDAEGWYDLGVFPSGEV